MCPSANKQLIFAYKFHLQKRRPLWSRPLGVIESKGLNSQLQIVESSGIVIYRYFSNFIIKTSVIAWQGKSAITALPFPFF